MGEWSGRVLLFQGLLLTKHQCRTNYIGCPVAGRSIRIKEGAKTDSNGTGSGQNNQGQQGSGDSRKSTSYISDSSQNLVLEISTTSE
jgi:hypothetical protein